ncbi:pPIWI_RE module domain-containing protein [Saccharopolyspora taberi]|uniref:DUF3893 domain-containing protein n=1 Tax=Saccharopolyspora taberi TaxID=60895 RepID=A0ABN3V096_9PSEU
MNPLIRVAAYEPVQPLAHTFRTIEFSERWRRELVSAYQRTFTRGREQRNLPIDAFNALLRASTPELIAARGATADPNNPWLYTTDPPSDDVLAILLETWVRDLLTRGRGAEEFDDDTIAHLVDGLADAVPTWSRTEVDLAAATLTEGGTARPDPRLYQLLPEFAAARLASSTYRFRGAELSFRVVTSRDQVELVSWPPRAHRAKGKDWYHSLRLRISVQTVPFTSAFRLHVTSGVRRWISGEPVKLRDRGITAYLQIPLPDPLRSPGVPRLIANRVGYDRQQRRVDWARNSLARLLPHLPVRLSLPSAEELLAEPDRWRHDARGVTAWLVHSTTLQADHEVGVGLLPVERSMIDSWVEEVLSPEFVRAPDLIRATRRTKPQLSVSRTDPDRRKVQDRRAAVSAAVRGDPLVIDIRFEHEYVKRALLKAVCSLLGLPPTGGLEGTEFEWRVGGLTVHVRTSQWASIPAELRVASGLSRRERAEAIALAVEQRRSEIHAHFGSVPLGAPVGLTLVELRNADMFGSDQDPKTAVRLGCADAHRVTQFITPGEENLSERAKSAVLDGLRQLGAVITPHHRLDVDVPANLQYVGMWMARKKSFTSGRRGRQVLIAVRHRLDEGTYRVEAWDDLSKDWIPYPKLLLQLARSEESDAAGWGREWMTRQEQQVHAQERIRAILYQVRDTPTLVMVQAANMRSSWPWLTNQRVVRDMLAFGDDPPQRLGLYGPDLRLVQIRDAGNRDEVPQWYAPRADDRIAGFASGLWQPRNATADNRVFMSVTEVSKQGVRPKQAVKYAEGPTSPTIPGWNPEYREIVVLGCRSEPLVEAETHGHSADTPLVWATLAHQLRHADDYVPLGLPLPLHLAALAEEYALEAPPDDQGASAGAVTTSQRTSSGPTGAFGSESPLETGR